MVRAAIALLLLIVVSSAAWAEARYALLIGNEAYSSEIGRLANPHNDVALLEQALKGLGFDVVTVRDAGLGALYQAVSGYARRLQAAGPNAIGFLYYSGHGASDGSANYLIPVDVKTTETGELWDQSLRLTEITRKLKAEAGNATHFVVFDACRNTLKLTQPGSRAVVQSKGFIPVAQENGMLVAYATAEGELASDVGLGAGPYAKALAEEIVKPGVEAVVMFRAVQRRVRAAIRQEPYLGFNALGDVYFAGKPDTVVSTGEAERAWAAVKDTKSPEVLQSFIERYKDTIYAELARAQKRDLEALRRNTQVALEMQTKLLEDAERKAKEQRAADLKKQQVATIPPPATQPLLPNLIDKTLGIVLPPAARNCAAGVEITVGEKERRCFKPGAGKTESFKDCPDCPEMVVVPAGVFTMGSPSSELMRNDKDEAQVQVTISKAFAVGRSAVTRGEYSVFVSETNHQSAGECNDYSAAPYSVPSDKRNWRSPGFSQTDRHPVVCVGLHDVSAYMAWLSTKTGKSYRLLSEAEREYVTRAGTTTTFWWGDRISISQANYNGSPYTGGKVSKARNATTPVDMFPPNPWGLRDVHGNVEEWTEGCARGFSVVCPRVLRGGSWTKSPEQLRAASRFTTLGEGPMTDVGFRVARSLEQ